MKKEYLELQYIIHNENEWTEENRDEFEDRFIELIEELGYKMAGTSSLKTEEEL